MRGLAAALTLGVGVGAATAAFAAVDGVLLRDLPVARQDELVVAWGTSERTSIPLPFNGVAFDAVSRGAPSLSAVAGVTAWGALPVAIASEGASYALNGSYVAGDFFGVLGARPVVGRLLRSGDDRPGAPRAVVLSHAAWRSRYAADPGVVGSTLLLGEEAVTVVGVAPDDLDYPPGTEIWYPLRSDYTDPSQAVEVHLLGRMAPGVDHATVASDVAAAIAGDAGASLFMSDARTEVRGLEEQIVGPLEPVLRAAFAAALVLLLAAAANATLFLLGAGPRAVREAAVRRALGAERAQLMSRSLADAAVVAAIAGVGGAVLAWIAVASLGPLAPPELPRLDGVTVGSRAAGFALLTSMLLAVACGALATLVLTRAKVGMEILPAGRGAPDGRSKFRRAIAGIQLALAVVTAAGAGLLVRTVVALNDLDAGFSAEDMTAVSLSVPYGWLDVPPAYLIALEEVVADLESRPGIVAARPSLGPPLQQRIEVRLRAEGQSDEDFQSNPAVAVDAVLPGHFEAMGIPILSGRGLLGSDDRLEAEPVVVVDALLAGALWPGESPLGKRLAGYMGFDETPFTVVGVASTTRYRELLVPHPRAYFPLRRVRNSPPSALLVRTSDASVPVRELAVAAFAEADPRVRVLDARRMPDVLREPTSGHRFAAAILVSFAGATLLIALLGVYGVFTTLVLERTRELGIRRALGAPRRGIARLVLARTLVVAVVGALAGCVGSLWANRLLASLLYGVEVTDARTLATVALGGVALACFAGLPPALRACSVDPGLSLRAE